MAPRNIPQSFVQYDEDGNAISPASAAGIGALTETAPANDTASSGLNGRLQRIAQRITSLIALLPTSLGAKSAAASMAVTLATDDAVLGRIGEVQASPTSNTLLDRLKTLATSLTAILAALGAKGYAATVSVTRTADTNLYAAGDVLGPATGSTAAITFANMGPAAGGEVMITSVTFQRDATALISGETSYTLHLYSITPPSALGDNAAWDLPSGDRDSYLGKISLGTPVDVGSTLRVEQDSVNKQITLAAGGSLFGLLVTDASYTPTSAAVHRVGIHSVAL